MRSSGVGSGLPSSTTNKNKSTSDDLMSVMGGSDTRVDNSVRCQISFSSQKKVDNGNGGDEVSRSRTFRDLLFCLNLPVIVLWARRCMFGAASLIHSLVVGQCLRLLIVNYSEWKPLLLQILVFDQSANGKINPRAWPPPTLVVLALLTIFALVVHPDGFTWILLGKMRDATKSIFSSAVDFWRVLVQDFGVIPTIAATATFAALIFLLFVVMKTLSPRKQKRVSTVPNKKKKKKRGHARHRGSGGGARIKASSSANSKPAPSPRNYSTALEIPSTPSGTQRKGSSQILSTPIKSENKSILSNKSKGPVISTIDAAITSLIPNSEKWNVNEKERNRLSSVSTLDTSALSDDQSCGSTSVRSVPSVNSNSSRMNETDQESRPTKVKTPSNIRGQKSMGKLTKSNKNNAYHANAESSRWDALKPNQNIQQKLNLYPQNHNHKLQGSFQNNGHNPYRKRRRGGNKAHKKGIHRFQPTSSQKAPLITSLKSHERASASNFGMKRVARQSITSPNTPSSKAMIETRLMLGKVPPTPPPGLGPIPLLTGFADDKVSNLNSAFIPLPSLPITLRGGISNADPSTALTSLLSAGNENCEFRGNSSIQTTEQFLPPSSTTVNGQFVVRGQKSPSLKENPFADSSDSRIEAELQELGGQMAGSILDF